MRAVVAVDRLDEREARHLLEILERLTASNVAAGEAASEWDIALDRRVAGLPATGSVVLAERAVVKHGFLPVGTSDLEVRCCCPVA